MSRILVLFGLFAGAALAQAQVTPTRVVRATGDATVSVKPDLVKITAGVVTQATTAQDAATQNASKTDAMLTALKQALGVNADIQTVSYSLTPNYQYPRPGDTTPPVLIGYTAMNNLQVTSSDLGNIGKVIDAATQAGANNVGGLQFTLKDPEPVKAQALTQAAQIALSHADAIAAGLKVTLGAVYSADEGATVRPVVMGATTAAAPSTPIETGLVVVQATVTIAVLIS